MSSQTFPSPSQLSHQQEENINGSIVEYLLKSGYFRTVDMFNSELESGPSEFDKYQKNPNLNFGQSLLMELFDSGKRKLFFENWIRLLPFHFRSRDSLCTVMEFYLHNIKDQNAINDEMKYFKSYLDRTPPEIAQKPEFMPYYALPYVKNPKTHPSFKNVLTVQYCQELREKLNIFLTHFLPVQGKASLFDLFTRGPNLDSNIDNSSLENNLYELERQLMAAQKKEELAKTTLIESQTKWVNFCKGMLNISKEIYEFHINKNSNDVKDPKIVECISKLQKYEQFILSNEKDFKELETNFHKSKIENNKLVEEEILSQSQINANSIQEPIQPNSEINFPKIKEFLATSEDSLKICALLQALRSRITHTHHGPERKNIINSFIFNDIFSCKSKNPFYEKLMKNPSRKVREYIILFLNILASEKSGIMYLSDESEIINILIDILFREKNNTALKQNALSSLQIFSLHLKPQNIMIEKGVIQWIVDILRTTSNEPINNNTIEYLTALLMNLSLRKSGKLKCEDRQMDILQVLNMYIEHENIQVRTHINGTLYSILTRNALKERAKELGMPEMLEYLMNNSQDPIKRQIKYILNQLNIIADDNDTQEENEDPAELEEDEDFATEIDAEIDPDILNAKILFGEELLSKEFSKETTSDQKRKIINVYNFVNKPTSASNSNLNSNLINKPPINSNLPRDIPSALRSRPKIPRTPLNDDVQTLVSNLALKKEKDNEIKIKNDSKENAENNLNLEVKSDILPPEKKIEVNQNSFSKTNQENIDNATPVKEDQSINPSKEESKVENSNSNPIQIEEGKAHKPVIVETIENSSKSDVIEGTKKLTETQEFQFAFKTRTKIVRTPNTGDRSIVSQNEKETVFGKVAQPPNLLKKANKKNI